MKTSLFAVVVALCTSFAVPQIATAGESPLFRAADEYRDAVLDFEREVFRSRHFGRDAELVADALEDASGRLRTAARRSDDLGRLLNEWHGIQCLMPRVETIVFGGPPCQDTAVLEFRWAHVQRTAAFVGQYIDALQPVVVGRPPFDDRRRIPPAGPVPSFRDPFGFPENRFPANSFPANSLHPGLSGAEFSDQVRSDRVDVSRLVIGLMDSAIRSRSTGARLQRRFD